MDTVIIGLRVDFHKGGVDRSAIVVDKIMEGKTRYVVITTETDPAQRKVYILDPEEVKYIDYQF